MHFTNCVSNTISSYNLPLTPLRQVHAFNVSFVISYETIELNYFLVLH